MASSSAATASPVAGKIQIPKILRSLEKEAELRAALPADQFASIQYNRIEFDKQYNAASMDLQSFDSKVLQADINHGGVVDWEILVQSRDDDNGFKPTLEKFKGCCMRLGIWDYMTAVIPEISYEDIAVFMNFARVTEDRKSVV